MPSSRSVRSSRIPTTWQGVLETILEALFRIFPQAERGFVLLKNEGGRRPCSQGVQDPRHNDAAT